MARTSCLKKSDRFFITQMLFSVSSVPLWSICLFNKSIIDER